MNSKRDLFKRKPDPWHILIRELREATPYLVFYGMLTMAFVVAMWVCLSFQASVAFGHEWGLI